MNLNTSLIIKNVNIILLFLIHPRFYIQIQFILTMLASTGWGFNMGHLNYKKIGATNRKPIMT
jgi:hypothetical protein